MRLHHLRSAMIAASILLSSFAAAQNPNSSSSKHSKASLPQPKSDLDAGLVTNGVYRNRTLGLSCKIPSGWVLRTDEMNRPNDDSAAGSAGTGRVLLAAFSRPPDARGEDINASILIAAEPQSSYPGLKEAAQYFGPLSEIAKAQGFDQDEEPYEFPVGAKNLPRLDFHKDVGSRVMRQSTLALLAHGYAISITVIGGSEDEVEQLMDGLSFTGAAK